MSRRNHREILHNTDWGNDFLEKDTKAQATKANIDK